MPGDRDISFKQKVLSDPSRASDLTINQSMGEKAVARRLYKKMNGREADTIEEALEFMKGKDVTYVHPEGDSAVNYVFEHNLEGYEDLAGMVGIGANGKMDKLQMAEQLHNLQINRAAVSGKGKEWIELGRKGVQQASKLEAEAASLTGAAKEAKLAEARTLRYFAQGQTVEGVRQISKQVKNIIVPRALKRADKIPLTPQAYEMYELALRVGDDIAPAEFEHILRRDFNLDLNGFCDYMASLLK